ncbi:MAG: PD40 domain-containing protein [Brevibacillus sp.]|nr:PD40 domain-containing protein [Brevibacillus sp.]
MKRDERHTPPQTEDATISLLLAHLQELREAVPVNYKLKEELKQKLKERIAQMEQSQRGTEVVLQKRRRRHWAWMAGILLAALVGFVLWPQDELRIGRPQTLEIPRQSVPERVALAPYDEHVAYLAEDNNLYTYSFADEHEQLFRLPATDGNYKFLSWANHSPRIAVTEADGERSRLWIVSMDTNGTQANSQLIWEEETGTLGSLAWSPDDRQIAFTIIRGGEQPEIWITDLVTLQTKKWTDGEDPAFSPAGNLLAYVKNGAVWVMNLADGPAFQIGAGAHPSWAADYRLTFTTGDGLLTAVDLSEYPHTSDFIPLAAVPAGELIQASWSRDGKHVLLAVKTEKGMLFSIAERD